MPNLSDTATDAFGVPLQPGDTIVYLARNEYNEQWLAKGTIAELTDYGNPVAYTVATISPQDSHVRTDDTAKLNP